MDGMKGEALLVVDMLNDFVLPGAPLEVPLARDIIPQIARRIEMARKAGIPVIYLCDAHAEDDDEFKIWPRHAVAKTDGARVVEDLKPGREDIVLAKTTYSAFYKTQLEEMLKTKNIHKITITGIVTNICVFFAAAGAVVRGFSVEVPLDSVAALTQREHDFALEQMKKILGVKIT